MQGIASLKRQLLYPNPNPNPSPSPIPNPMQGIASLKRQLLEALSAAGLVPCGPQGLRASYVERVRRETNLTPQPQP